MNFLSNYQNKNNSDTSFKDNNNFNNNENNNLFLEFFNVNTHLALYDELFLDDSNNEYESQINDKNIFTFSISNISI